MGSPSNRSSSRGGFTVGDLVQVQGLKARPDLNGRLVALMEWDEEAGRWASRFSGADPPLKIRPANLLSVPAVTPDAEALAGLVGPRRTMAQIEEASKSGPWIRKRGIDWRMRHLTEDAAARGDEACVSTLRQLRSRKGSEEGEWYVYVRRGRVWTGPSQAKRRIWFVAVAMKPNVVYCFLVDGPRAEDVKEPVPVGLVCGVLDDVMQDCDKWPSIVGCAPLPTASFRPKMAADLAFKLNEILSPHYLPAEAVSCDDPPEDRPGSILGMATNMAALKTGAWAAFMEQIEDRLVGVERQINSKPGSVDVSCRLSGYLESSPVPNSAGHGLNTDASIQQLRDLFDGSKMFHEREPWNVFSNKEYVQIRDPTSGEEVWAMVTGFTDYSGRGLNVCQSLEDLHKMYLQPERSRPKNHVFRLQFSAPATTAYGTLDNVVGLDLPLPSNALDGENIPLWYTIESGSRFLPGEDIDEIISDWSNPPDHAKWQFLANVARVTAIFATSPDLVMRGPGNDPCIMNASPVFMNGLQVMGGSFKAPQPRMKLSDELATMSIGDTTKCNFCNKPNASEMQVDCQRCGIRYCSERCRSKDRIRHTTSCGGAT